MAASPRTTAALIGVCLLTSCSGSTSEPATDTVELTGTSFAFLPAELSLPANSAVQLVYIVEDAPHDLVVEGHDLHLAGDAGDRLEGILEVGSAGTYRFSCTLPGHRGAGMTGTLRVD